MQINVWILAYKQNLEALARQLYDFGLCNRTGEYLWYTTEKVP